MKTLIATAVSVTLFGASMAYASGSMDEAEQAVQIGTEYGITHFQSIELDDDDDDRMEIQGWLDDNWFVELEVNARGEMAHEERNKRVDGPWGMTADEVGSYLDAAAGEGMTRMEEIEISVSGNVEVEGTHRNGLELEVEFRQGNPTPVNIDLDD